jgi:hypothetical protein
VNRGQTLSKSVRGYQRIDLAWRRGEIFEMYCPELKAAATVVRGRKQGDSYAIDFVGLSYEWKG